MNFGWNLFRLTELRKKKNKKHVASNALTCTNGIAISRFCRTTIVANAVDNVLFCYY